MTSATSAFTGELALQHVRAPTQVALMDVVVVRHTYTVGGLETAADLTPQKVVDYFRRQAFNNRLGKHPPGCGSCSSLTERAARASLWLTRITES